MLAFPIVLLLINLVHGAPVAVSDKRCVGRAEACARSIDCYATGLCGPALAKKSSLASVFQGLKYARQDDDFGDDSDDDSDFGGDDSFDFGGDDGGSDDSSDDSFDFGSDDTSSDSSPDTSSDDSTQDSSDDFGDLGDTDTGVDDGSDDTTGDDGLDGTDDGGVDDGLDGTDDGDVDDGLDGTDDGSVDDGSTDTTDADSTTTAADASITDAPDADSSDDTSTDDTDATTTDPDSTTTAADASITDAPDDQSTTTDTDDGATSTDSDADADSTSSASNSATDTSSTTSTDSASATDNASATSTASSDAAAASATSSLTCGSGPIPNDATISLIEKFEGFVPSPAPDPIGLPTVGFGHKCTSKSCAIAGFSFPLTQDTAAQLLNQDVQQFVSCVNNAVSDSVTLTDNQVGALTSFSFNLGCKTLQTSTLLKRLNNGEDPNTVAAQEIPRFNKAGGKVLSGLTSRRAAEVTLFQTPSQVQAHPC